MQCILYLLQRNTEAQRVYPTETRDYGVDGEQN